MLPTPFQRPQSAYSRPLGQTKKSHSRKQPPGHVPRPRNAFIIFRCDFVQQKKLPESVEHDHRNISRIVGKIWREMSDAEKAPWFAKAEREKQEHNLMFPGYRYIPGAYPPSKAGLGRRKRGDQRNDPGEIIGFAQIHPVQLPPRRSSSCPPPGSVPVTPINGISHEAHGLPLETRDDLSRRPSRTTMYQSTPPSPPKSFAPALEAVTFPWAIGDRGPPSLSGANGIISPPFGKPGWDAMPPEPYNWTEWDAETQVEQFGDLNFSAAELNDLVSTFHPPTFINPFTTLQSMVTPPDSESSHAFAVSPFEGAGTGTGANILTGSPPTSLSAGPANFSGFSNNQICASSPPHLRQHNSTVDLGIIFPRMSLDDTVQIEQAMHQDQDPTVGRGGTGLSPLHSGPPARSQT